MERLTPHILKSCQEKESFRCQRLEVRSQKLEMVFKALWQFIIPVIYKRQEARNCFLQFCTYFSKRSSCLLLLVILLLIAEPLLVVAQRSLSAFHYGTPYNVKNHIKQIYRIPLPQTVPVEKQLVEYSSSHVWGGVEIRWVVRFQEICSYWEAAQTYNKAIAHASARRQESQGLLIGKSLSCMGSAFPTGTPEELFRSKN